MSGWAKKGGKEREEKWGERSAFSAGDVLGADRLLADDYFMSAQRHNDRQTTRQPLGHDFVE